MLYYKMYYYTRRDYLYRLPHRYSGAWYIQCCRSRELAHRILESLCWSRELAHCITVTLCRSSELTWWGVKVTHVGDIIYYYEDRESPQQRLWLTHLQTLSGHRRCFISLYRRFKVFVYAPMAFRIYRYICIQNIFSGWSSSLRTFIEYSSLIITYIYNID